MGRHHGTVLALGVAAPILAACSGGEGPPSIADYNTLNASYGSASPSYTATADLPAGSVDYQGIAKFWVSSDMDDLGMLARVDMTVDFDLATDHINGSATNFARIVHNGDGYHTTQNVDGSLTISGSLTGVNSADGNGLGGSAIGTIGGNDANMVLTGHFSGPSGQIVNLGFDGELFYGSGLVVGPEPGI